MEARLPAGVDERVAADRIDDARPALALQRLAGGGEFGAVDDRGSAEAAQVVGHQLAQYLLVLRRRELLHHGNAPRVRDVGLHLPAQRAHEGLLDAPRPLGEIAGAVATPGGISEMLLATLADRGALAAWDEGLDRVLKRIMT